MGTGEKYLRQKERPEQRGVGVGACPVGGRHSMPGGQRAGSMEATMPSKGAGRVGGGKARR